LSQSVKKIIVYSETVRTNLTLWIWNIIFKQCVSRNGSLAFAWRVGLCGWGKSQCAVCGSA